MNEDQPPIRCDLTLQELLSEVNMAYEPTASEVITMDNLTDEQHFIPHDPHSKKAAGKFSLILLYDQIQK